MANEELIHNLLSGDNMDGVKLGATMMEKLIPREQWDIYLIKHSASENTIFQSPKWRYSIVDNHIEIWKDSGIWGQLKGGGYKTSYNLDNFNMDVLKEAIEGFYNNKTNNDE